ncbi:MAG: hypothetical protein WCF84_06280 [Anaerolineae bacterium]
MATDLYRIFQRMDLHVQSRRETPLRGWLRLALWLILLGALIGAFNVAR